MISPYIKCPKYENEKYLLRFIETSDSSDLLAVYSNEKAVPFLTVIIVMVTFTVLY